METVWEQSWILFGVEGFWRLRIFMPTFTDHSRFIYTEQLHTLLNSCTISCTNTHLLQYYLLTKAACLKFVKFHSYVAIGNQTVFIF